MERFVFVSKIAQIIKPLGEKPLVNDSDNKSHSGEAAALGFYYQTFFALLTLLERDTDNAAIGIEQLDDVYLKVDGQTLLFQLKHSVSANPQPITLKSRALWRTMKVWIDVLPHFVLSEATLHLVTVASIAKNSELAALTSVNADREVLVKAMVGEAQSVMDARVAAAKLKKALPYTDRFEGCKAFLEISDTDRLNILRRTLIKQASPGIGDIEELIVKNLTLLPPVDRPKVAKRLIEWWDRQVVYSLCGKRDRVISRSELQYQISAIVGDLEQSKLLPDFEIVAHPEDYQPDGILARQIHLVEGKPSDLSKAIREEWKAREQRSKWLNEKPNMATVIGEYDLVLKEHWFDHHSQMVEDCAEMEENEKCAAGLGVLRWTHEKAPHAVRPIAQGWNAPYYVRGSYQVLAIDREVGWHPDYLTLLGGDD